MGSLLEELARREAEVRQRIDEVRDQITELTTRLEAEEDRLSRLVIARETVEEILGEAVQLVEESSDDGAGVADTGADAEASPIGVTTVPRWRSGMGVSVLPRAYQDAVEILVDAGEAMRAGQLLAAMGLPDAAAKREGLRSKLKRLVERGWLSEDGPGLFVASGEVARQVANGKAGEGVIGSSPAG
jgi:chromosome segregation ATPase